MPAFRNVLKGNSKSVAGHREGPDSKGALDSVIGIVQIFCLKDLAVLHYIQIGPGDSCSAGLWPDLVKFLACPFLKRYPGQPFRFWIGIHQKEPVGGLKLVDKEAGRNGLHNIGSYLQ